MGQSCKGRGGWGGGGAQKAAFPPSSSTHIPSKANSLAPAPHFPNAHPQTTTATDNKPSSAVQRLVLGPTQSPPNSPTHPRHPPPSHRAARRRAEAVIARAAGDRSRSRVRAGRPSRTCRAGRAARGREVAARARHGGLRCSDTHAARGTSRACRRAAERVVPRAAHDRHGGRRGARAPCRARQTRRRRGGRRIRAIGAGDWQRRRVRAREASAAGDADADARAAVVAGRAHRRRSSGVATVEASRAGSTVAQSGPEQRPGPSHAG